MNKDNCFYLGVITKPQGLKGNVSVYLDVDNPGDYSKMESVFVEINKSLVPFFIEYVQVRNRNQAIIKFEGVESEEEAARMVKNELWLPVAVLPKLKGNKFYYHEVKGFAVIDARHGPVGTISEILEYPNNTLLQLDFNGREILVPILEEVILDVDRSKKEMHIKAPTGLIDIYLTDKHSPEDEDEFTYTPQNDDE